MDVFRAAAGDGEAVAQYFGELEPAGSVKNRDCAEVALQWPRFAVAHELNDGAPVLPLPARQSGSPDQHARNRLLVIALGV